MPEVSLKDALSEIVFSCRVLSQGRDATIAEIEGFLSGPLATAVARTRREALEEAAEAADAEEMVRSVGGQSRLAGDAIRALAAAPPEARQTETGWKPPAGWKLVPEIETIDMLDLGRATADEKWSAWTGGRKGLDGMIVFVREAYRAMVAAAPPPPAIGNLEGDGRSHG